MAIAPNPRVFLDVAVGRRAVGRLKFELFHDVLPITAENFRCLCTGETGLGYWLRPRWFKDTRFHRIVPNFMCQGGDFNFGNGTMGESIYGQYFRDEKHCYKHSKRGVLSMARTRMVNTNNSIFFITFAPCPWLDGRHVVFGQVVDGMEVLDAIEESGSESGIPTRKVWVHNSGEEDRLQLRREALEAPESAAAQASEGHELAAQASVPFQRPAAHPHRDEISPVPNEIWRRAKARRDSML